MYKIHQAPSIVSIIENKTKPHCTVCGEQASQDADSSHAGPVDGFRPKSRGLAAGVSFLFTWSMCIQGRGSLPLRKAFVKYIQAILLKNTVRVLEKITVIF